jgi:hypothetical protein
MNLFPHGIADAKERPVLISDYGCQPTSEGFMKATSTLGIKRIFTSWNNLQVMQIKTYT